jgi:peptidoglycan/xylan/chitin deacetylase (PgdA/CDA1 family)
MRESKLVEFHGHTHRLHQRNKQLVSRLLTVKYNTLRNDLLHSKIILRTNYFAYPFGQYNRRSINALKQTGYTMVFTTKEGFVRPGDPLFELPRRGVGPKASLRDFRVILGESSFAINTEQPNKERRDYSNHTD